MLITYDVFVTYNNACIDFLNCVTNTYNNPDNQQIEYKHFKSIISQHYPNGLSFENIIKYFINKDVLVGFCPYSIYDNHTEWMAMGVYGTKVIICNQFNTWNQAYSKCIEYGFQLIEENKINVKLGQDKQP